MRTTERARGLFFFLIVIVKFFMCLFKSVEEGIKKKLVEFLEESAAVAPRVGIIGLDKAAVSAFWRFSHTRAAWMERRLYYPACISRL